MPYDFAMPIGRARPVAAAIGQRRKQTPDRNDKSIATCTTGEGDDVISALAVDWDRPVISGIEHMPKSIADLQQVMEQRELDCSIPPGIDQEMPVAQA